MKLPQGTTVVGSGSVQAQVETGFPTLKQVTSNLFNQALEASGGNKAKAAQLLGVSVKTVYNFLGKNKSDSV